MGDAARQRASYKDVLNAPEHLLAEVIDGELYLSPRPGPLHTLASTIIGADIAPVMARRGGGGGGWRILDEPELHLDADIVVPDLAGWRIERMPRMPREAYFTLAPDWVCEVLSPGTMRTDRTRKKRLYARQRVEYLWMVDPVAHTLEVYRLEGEFWQELAVHGGDVRSRIPPFEELELDIGAWWEETGVEEGGVITIEEFQAALPVMLASRENEWYSASDVEEEEHLAGLCEMGFLQRRLRDGTSEGAVSRYEYQGSDRLMAVLARFEKEGR